MSNRSVLVRLLPGFVQAVPADLMIVLLSVAATGITVFTPVLRSSPLRVILGVPFVLFIPGYALIAVLFPEAPPQNHPTTGVDADEATGIISDRIDGIERLTLSFATSIALIIFCGLFLEISPWEFGTVTLFVSVAGFVLVATVVAIKRRRELSAENRYTVPIGHWYRTVRHRLGNPPTRVDFGLNILLVVGVVLTVVTVGFGVGEPTDEGSFTEMYLLTETATGDLVARDYPTEFTSGQQKQVVIGLDNHEHETTSYTTVIKLQEVADDETTVVRENELDRFTITLAHNQSDTIPHSVEPDLSGPRLRLAYLLYRGEPPAEPTTENAYRETHLWINVTAAE
jgi:uncharacterized membrane protein